MMRSLGLMQRYISAISRLHYGQNVFSRISYGTSSQVSLDVFPKSALVDASLNVKVSGLNPFQFITLHSNITNEGNKFAAVAHYVSDLNGVVDTSSQPSVGGNYIGTEPEGLIWSMAPLPGHSNFRRMIKLDVTTPYLLNISLYKDHLEIIDIKDGDKIASDSVERWYMSKDVERIPVRDGRVRGVLFMPKGKGPFLPVIDMFGSIGKILEFRASLLASRGFAVLALPFFGYDDLPKTLKELNLDYFEEAVAFMVKHPKIKSKGVGIIGTSKGGEAAHFMAEFLPEVKAVISIGTGAIMADIPGVSKKRNIYRPGADFTATYKNAPKNKDGQYVFRLSPNITTPEYFEDMFENHRSNIDKSDAHFLIVCGTLDMCVNPLIAASTAKILERAGKKNYELLLYPGAGHLIEPPHGLLGTTGIVRVFGKHIYYYGGEPSLHAKAQVHLWNKMQRFFNKYLSI